jgi:hypothetical protein
VRNVELFHAPHCRSELSDKFGQGNYCNYDGFAIAINATSLRLPDGLTLPGVASPDFYLLGWASLK